MNHKHIEEQIIANYQKDERMMILVFSQWCINHDLDPVEIYKEAYPEQAENQTLKEAMELTVSKEEAGPIKFETMIGVLSLFGNEDLAFVVTEKYEEMKKKRT